MTNSFTEIPEVKMQLLVWQATLHFYVHYEVQVCGNSCTCYLPPGGVVKITAKSLHSCCLRIHSSHGHWCSPPVLSDWRRWGGCESPGEPSPSSHDQLLCPTHSGHPAGPSPHPATGHRNTQFADTLGHNDTCYSDTLRHNDPLCYRDTLGHSDPLHYTYSDTLGCSDTLGYSNTFGHSDTLHYSNTLGYRDILSYRDTLSYSDILGGRRQWNREKERRERKREEGKTKRQRTPTRKLYFTRIVV